ncbi:MAG: hypothetical protein C0467_06265 [Planctomycetaceae bacterium]|nr:hypothetical protein [Planctomycetaceae bacterium]
MPQGVRGWWVRAIHMGLGAVLCAGAIGCMNTDKDKISPPPRIGANGGKQQLPPPGLPGLQPLPGSTTPVGAAPKAGQPGYNSPFAGAGATGTPAATNFGAAGQPPARTIGQPVTPAGFNSPTSAIPSVGPGGAGQMPPPSFETPGAQSRIGGSPPPPNLNELGPVPPGPPPGGVTSNSHYSPVTAPQPLAPIKPNDPVYANVSAGVYQMR